MSHELCFASATDLARLIRERAVTCQAVMRAHLDQIERVNPRVNAIVTLLPDQAMQGAREADRKLASGERLGPLHGLPVAHKDLLVTKGIRTTFGSPDLPRLRAGYRCDHRRAVARGRRDHHRQDQHAGVRRRLADLQPGVRRDPQPLGRRRRPAAAAAAVRRSALACGMVPIADGSDLGGSLRNPASFCNVVGLRPAAGRVPVWPSSNAWFPLPVLGPMGRTVEDVALLLSVLAGPDPRAPISIAEPGSVFAGPLERDLTRLAGGLEQ